MASAGAGHEGSDGFSRRGDLGCGGSFAGATVVPTASAATTASVGSRSSAWDNFHRLDEIFDPMLHRRRQAELAWFHAKEAAEADDVAAVVRLPTLREEFDLQGTFCSTLMYYIMHVDESSPIDATDSDSDDKSNNDYI
ncbi:hypothetical protein ZWY2020_035951 [Hordeum vulgare]|nr:hypothetical protein ZWY2020_035951 [Hordeum vulgare]